MIRDVLEEVVRAAEQDHAVQSAAVAVVMRAGHLVAPARGGRVGIVGLAPASAAAGRRIGRLVRERAGRERE
jgi:hypothetical protein